MKHIMIFFLLSNITLFGMLKELSWDEYVKCKAGHGLLADAIEAINERRKLNWHNRIYQKGYNDRRKLADLSLQEVLQEIIKHIPKNKLNDIITFFDSSHNMFKQQVLISLKKSKIKKD